MEQHDKKELRKIYQQKRNSLNTQEIKEKSLQAVKNIISIPAFQKADTVMIYRSFQSELVLDSILVQDKRFVYPLCTSKTEMSALLPFSWKQGPLGIFEPDPDNSFSIPPEEIDFIVCPGTAFDDHCMRLGMGAGYYDRFLQKCKNAVVIMAAFEIQHTDIITADPWDRTMDMIVTEEKIYYPG